MNHLHRSRKYFALFTFLWVGAFLTGKGQEACFFFPEDSVGCAPFTVRVTSCADPSAIISFNFRWKPDPNPDDYQTLAAGQTEAFFTYPEPGEYIIEQLRGGNQILQRRVRVYNIEAKPRFERTTCKDTLILTFVDTVFSAYRFDPGDGTPELIISDRSRPFKYKYSFTGQEASFSYVLKGEKPATCNKDPISGTISLYKNEVEVPADSLIGLDTNLYRIRVQTRADEAFAYQLRESTDWMPIFTGITEESDPFRTDILTLSGIRPGMGVRVVASNGCGKEIPSPDWTVTWPSAIPDNQRIFLRWHPISTGNLIEYQLLRNGTPIRNLLVSSDSAFTDSTDLICGETYCYQILTKRETGGQNGKLVFISAPICARAISNRPPDPVQLLTGTVTESGVQLHGKASPLAKIFEVFRKEKDAAGGFGKIGDFQSLPLTDTSANTQTTAYCYQIRYRDICGNQSLISDTLCPILLQLQTNSETEKAFSWTALQGWKGGVDRYELLRSTEIATDPEENLYIGPGLGYLSRQRDPVRQKIFYQVRAIPREATSYPEPSFSNRVEVIQIAKLRFPDVFTPNEDNQNDQFRCYSLFITDYELRIYNAWGNEIFSSRDIKEGWKGTIDTRPAPSGPYAFWAKGTDQEGNRLETRGIFTLVR